MSSVRLTLNSRAWTDPTKGELDWYRRKGLYPHLRIVKKDDGSEYVTGDWAWERAHPDKPEAIEGRMQIDGVYG